MHLAALLFFVAAAVALLALPRKWAPVPLLVSCCYMTTGQGMDVGPFSLPLYRMVLAVGLARSIIRRERIAGAINGIDVLIATWAAWILVASLFHEWAPGSGPVFAAGLVFNTALVYFLVRVWCRDLDELRDVCRVVAFMLIPIAAEMVFEHVKGRNLFAVLGGVDEQVFVRNGVFRAQGPFGHPILAGTVGAVCVPLMAGLWRRHRAAAAAGMVACIVMVVTSASSGPAMSFLVAVGALMMWRWREWTKVGYAAAAAAYVGLEILMTRPAYYIISKFDVTGSSTGWYRSRLIESSLEHLGEWWLVGTDRTRHWMHVAIDERHTDLANYYILVGVIGGLPALLLLVAILWQTFRTAGASIRRLAAEGSADSFMLWCFGAGLFAHAATSLSVAYFDQSVVFFWLNVAIISSMYSVVAAARAATPAAAAPPACTPVPASSRTTARINPAWLGR